MVQQLFIGFIVAALKLIAAIILSIGGIYTGVNLLDRLTQGIDEWKEIRKGNVAIGLLIAAVMASIIFLVQPRITDFVFSIRTDLPLGTVAKLLAITFVNYLLGLLASVFVIFLSINVIDRITHDLDEFSELKKGNVAVALILAAALVLVTLAVKAPLDSAFTMLISMETSLL